MTYQANTQEIWASGVFINNVKYIKKVFTDILYFTIFWNSKTFQSCEKSIFIFS